MIELTYKMSGHKSHLVKNSQSYSEKTVFSSKSFMLFQLENKLFEASPNKEKNAFHVTFWDNPYFMSYLTGLKLKNLPRISYYVEGKMHLY